MAEIIKTEDLTPESIAGMNKSVREYVYNALDCMVTGEIHTTLSENDNPINSKTYALSMALQKPILDMGLRGTKIDLKRRDEVLAEYRATRDRLRAQFDRLLEEAFGIAISPTSPTQLKTLFYEILALTPVRKRNARGVFAPTVNREALETLQRYMLAEPLCRFILSIRDLNKKIGFLKTGLDPDNRIRCNFNIAGTNTGRLASSMSEYGTGTNLQNIDKSLRETFVADKGMKFCNIDLEQADSRNVGALIYHLFDDPSYLDACESGDLHTTVCRMAWPHLGWGDNPARWRAVADQIAYRDMSYRDLAKRLGHGCLTTDHEVLTPNGWVPISTCPTYIMAWNPLTETLNWEEPSHWENKPWHGDLYEITGQQYHLTVTSDHRMPVFTKKGKSHEQPAERFTAFPELNLKNHGRLEKLAGSVTPAQARLSSAAMADAHIYPNGAVRFGFSKQRKKDRIIALLGDRHYTICEYPERGETYYHLPAESVDFPILKSCNASMFEWGYFALRAWVDELPHWDGTQQGQFTWVYGKDREHMRWMHTICFLVGQGSSYHPNEGHNCARVGLNSRKNKRIGSLTTVKKPGLGRRVYCPTVPSSGFLVRRNGVVMTSLNTNYYGTPRTMAKHSKVAVAIIQEFQDAYYGRLHKNGTITGGAFPSIHRWHQWVDEQLRAHASITTILGRKRNFFGRIPDASTLRKAIAFCGQSATADEMNIGLVRLWQDVPEAQLLIQVHDSILFQYPEEIEDEIIPRALSALLVTTSIGKDFRPFSVPLEAQIGWNWGPLKKDKSTGEVKNPNGLINWQANTPDQRARERTIWLPSAR